MSRLSDNFSTEDFLNDLASTADGLARNLRTYNPQKPIDGYQVSHQEIASGDGTSYYGFEDKDGRYYIMRAVKAGALTTYTYVAGTTGYAAAWTGRAGGGVAYASFATTF